MYIMERRRDCPSWFYQGPIVSASLFRGLQKFAKIRIAKIRKKIYINRFCSTFHVYLLFGWGLFVGRNVVVFEKIVGDFSESFCGGLGSPFAGARMVVFDADYEFWIVDWAVAAEGGNGCAGAF